MFWHSLRKKGFIPLGGDLIALEFSPKLFPTNRFFYEKPFHCHREFNDSLPRARVKPLERKEDSTRNTAICSGPQKPS